MCKWNVMVQEQLVTREHRKEARKRKKAGEASGAQPGDGPGGSAANGSTEKDVVVENADELPPQVEPFRLRKTLVCRSVLH